MSHLGWIMITMLGIIVTIIIRSLCVIQGRGYKITTMPLL